MHRSAARIASAGRVSKGGEASEAHGEWSTEEMVAGSAHDRRPPSAEDPAAPGQPTGGEGGADRHAQRAARLRQRHVQLARSCGWKAQPAPAHRGAAPAPSICISLARAPRGRDRGHPAAAIGIAPPARRILDGQADLDQQRPAWHGDARRSAASAMTYRASPASLPCRARSATRSRGSSTRPGSRHPSAVRSASSAMMSRGSQQKAERRHHRAGACRRKVRAGRIRSRSLRGRECRPRRSRRCARGHASSRR